MFSAGKSSGGSTLSFADDHELQALFRTEVSERAKRLINGASAMADGLLEPGCAHEMYREGHTIKGTARMMGFNAIADAGKLLEDVWRSIDEGETRPDRNHGRVLGALAKQLLPAIDADPAKGTGALARHMAEVHRATSAEQVAGLRQMPSAPEPAPLVAQPSMAATDVAVATEGGDLGGLIGNLDSYAFGENVRVNAASLFQLINEICSLRVDAEALSATVAELRDGAGDSDRIQKVTETLGAGVAALDKAVFQLQDQALELAAAPINEITNTFPQLVRYVARKSGKEIRFELVGDHHAIDRQVLERLADPLRQLLVNAVEHGVERPDERIAAGKSPTATISLHASVEDHRLEIVIEDDGAGIDWQAVRRSAIRRGLLPQGREDDHDLLRSLLFATNFSTADPGELVGDGNGLAAVSDAIDSLHGNLMLSSIDGRGVTITIAVPTSRALQDAVLVRAAGQIWGIPELAVLDRVERSSLSPAPPAGSSNVHWSEHIVPLRSFAGAVGLSEREPSERVLIVSSPSGPVAFAVAADLGRRQVAARELGPILNGVPHLTGAALLGGGNVAVIVDPARLSVQAEAAVRRIGPRPRILVVDDSRGARQVVGGALGSAGFDVDLAGSPTEALVAIEAQAYDGIVMDYVLPTMDGATLVQRIRAEGIRVPIVMLSGQATEQDQARALRAGADAYFDKDDVRKGALATALDSLISEHGLVEGAA